MQYEKSSVFCRKKFCHLGRTAQQKFGRTVWPNRTFSRSLQQPIWRLCCASWRHQHTFMLCPLQSYIQRKFALKVQVGKICYNIVISETVYLIQKMPFQKAIQPIVPSNIQQFMLELLNWTSLYAKMRKKNRNSTGEALKHFLSNFFLSLSTVQ